MSMTADVVAEGRLTTGSLKIQRLTVHDRLAQIDEGLDQLEGLIGHLRERLGPVFVEEPGPSRFDGREDSLSPSKETTDSWLAGQLAETNARLQLLGRSLGMLTERIDL